MLPELHAFKVLFYAESVGVVTFGHVTKMAVTRTIRSVIAEYPMPYANFTTLSSIEPELLPIKVFRQHLSYDGCLDVRGEIIRIVL